jgi:NDP-sugar pyrophosphorylase family protein
MTPKGFVGFILAAGEGTRLRPLTQNKPKPLVEVLGKPLIHYSFEALREIGVRTFVVNAFYLADQIAAYLQWRKTQYFDEEIELIQESQLLGTGGGVYGMYQSYLKRHPYTDFDAIVLNADALFDFKLTALLQHHIQKKSLATLTLKKSNISDPFARVHCDAHGKVVRIAEVEGKRTQDAQDVYAYLGIQIISREILSRLKPDFSDIFRTAYRDVLADDCFDIEGYDLTQNQQEILWFDVGTPKDYLDAHLYLTSHPNQSFNQNISIDPEYPTVIQCTNAQLLIKNNPGIIVKLENICIGEGAILEIDLSSLAPNQCLELRNIVIWAQEHIKINHPQYQTIYYQGTIYKL